ncbi:MAG: ArgR family transcriptional regulator [Planctomycetes bacterium]|nr:ArgR family transcriptional regulator [Planctomycetota bacterium]
MPARPEDRETRHRAIRDILAREAVANQDELVAQLEAQGLRTTQSGISRDLRHLGVIKQNGRYRLPANAASDERALAQLAPLLHTIRTAGPNLLVCLTETGSASRAALTLDRAALPEVVGTIAGDDTIFIAVDTSRDQARLVGLLRRIMTEVPR